MPLCCILLHTPELPEQLVPAAQACKAARAAGFEALLLHTGEAGEPAQEALVRLSVETGASCRHLGEFTADEGLPLLPPNEPLRLSRAVHEALARLGCAALLCIRHPELAAISLEARRCAPGDGPGSVLLLAAPTRPARRRQEASFPEGGRADMTADALEARALGLADQVLALDASAAEDLRGRTREGRLSLLPEEDSARRASLEGVLRRKADAHAAPPPAPRISVCIPFFEQDAELPAALASLQTQTLAPHEVVLVDDGSRNEQTRRFLAQLPARFEGLRLRLFRQENAGPAAARNRAAREATGPVLVFCDADNRFRPRMLEKLAGALLASGADAATCAFAAFREEAGGGPLRHEYVLAPCPAAESLALVENCLGDTNFAMRREDFLARGGFPDDNRSASEDWQFLLSLQRTGGSLVAVPEVLLDYRLSEASHSHSRSERAGAEAALGSELAGLPRAWAGAWEHLVGLVRNPSGRAALAAAEVQRAAMAAELAPRLASERALRERAAALEQAGRRLGGEIEELTRGLRQLSEKAREHRLEGEQARLQAARGQAELEACERSRRELEELCAKLDRRVAADAARLEEQRARLESLDDSLARSEEHVRALGRECEERRREAAALAALAAQRLASLETLQSNLQAREAAWAGESARLAARLDSLSARAEDLASRLAATDEALAATRVERDDARAGVRRGLLCIQELETSVAELRGELGESRREAAVRLARLGVSAEQAARLAAELGARNSALEQLRARLQAREQAWLAESARLGGELAALSERAAALERELAARNDKVRRMQASLSWRLTAPLRALRRATLDRLARRPAAAPPRPAPATPSASAAASSSPPQASPAPSFRFHIDAPRSWKPSPGPVTVRGWCLSPELPAHAGLRARIGSRIHEGTTNLPRPDIVIAFPQWPQGAASGFQVDISIHEGDSLLRLELQDQAGAWHCFLEQPLGAEDPAAPGSYAHWVARYDTPDKAALDALREQASAWTRRPRVSVLMPVYNTPAKWLLRAVESVRAQTYADWELCIADDASPASHVAPLLEELAASSPRIRIARLPANGHICRATNAALELATGELCVLLDHDDELAPHALHCIVAEFLAHPGAELVYSDEDKIDEQGCRFDPHFKPDWNPELLESQNYICHLAGLRTSTLRRLGGLRPGLEGSQDWDLFLRLGEGLPATAVRHVPRILYHWRAISGSTALHTGEKDYISRSASRALSEHFARLGVEAVLDRTPGGHWHARWPLPARPPLVSLIIPTKNAARLVRLCIDSVLARTAYPHYEILLVDNRSDDPVALAEFEALHRDYGVRVLRYDEHFNYSAINNFAAAHARGELLCLLNNDIEVIAPDWLGEMVAQALRPEIGAVGARLYYPDNRLQHAGVITGLGGVAGHAFKHFARNEPGVHFRPHLTQSLSAVTAACLVIRKAVFDEVGGLNERELAIAFNDVDFCLRVRARGYRNVYAPAAELYHHESVSRGAEDSPEKIRRFQGEIEVMKRTWGESLLRDPAYNPNYSLDSEDFALAYPPRVPPLGS